MGSRGPSLRTTPCACGWGQRTPGRGVPPCFFFFFANKFELTQESHFAIRMGPSRSDSRVAASPGQVQPCVRGRGWSGWWWWWWGGRLVSYHTFVPTIPIQASCSCHPRGWGHCPPGGLSSSADGDAAGSVDLPAVGSLVASLGRYDVKSPVDPFKLAHTLPAPEADCDDRRFLETPTHAFLIGEFGIRRRSGLVF